MTKSAFLLAAKRQIVHSSDSKKPAGTLQDVVYVDEEDLHSVVTWDLARAAEVRSSAIPAVSF